MSIWNRLKRLGKSEILDRVVKTEDPRKQIQLLAQEINDAILGSQKKREEILVQRANFEKRQKSYQVDNDNMEKGFRSKKSRGEEISHEEVRLLLNRKNLIGQLQQRIEQCDGVLKEIDLSILELADRHNRMMVRLEDIRLQQEANEMGLDLPEVIQSDIRMLDNRVEHTIRDIAMQGNVNPSSNAVTYDEIKDYIAHFE